MKLRLSQPATREFDRIFAYIKQRNPQGARNVQTRIWLAMTMLIEHPFAETDTGIRGLRRYAVVPYPYVVHYRVQNDEVIVVRFNVGRRPRTNGRQKNSSSSR